MPSSKEPIREQIFLDFQVLESKFVKFLKRQFNSSLNFALFFIAMTHNSSVNFKLINFLLWTKESHQSPNFDTFNCSGENFPIFSCHFLNYKSVFLQILHHSTVSWKITPLYIFSSNIIYFVHKEPIKTQFFRLLSARVKICQIPHVNFKTTSQFLFLYHSSLSWHATPL